MKNGIYNLYIEADEEVTTIISRLHGARAQQIALIVPQHALVLQSIINLRLLAREAHKREREIVIVTADEDGAAFAERAGISTVALSEWHEGAPMQVAPEGQRMSDVAPAQVALQHPMSDHAPVEPQAADEIGSQGFFAPEAELQAAQDDVDAILSQADPLVPDQAVVHEDVADLSVGGGVAPAPNPHPHPHPSSQQMDVAQAAIAHEQGEISDDVVVSQAPRRIIQEPAEESPLAEHAPVRAAMDIAPSGHRAPHMDGLAPASLIVTSPEDVVDTSGSDVVSPSSDGVKHVSIGDAHHDDENVARRTAPQTALDMRTRRMNAQGKHSAVAEATPSVSSAYEHATGAQSVSHEVVDRERHTDTSMHDMRDAGDSSDATSDAGMRADAMFAQSAEEIHGAQTQEMSSAEDVRDVHDVRIFYDRSKAQRDSKDTPKKKLFSRAPKKNKPPKHTAPSHEHDSVLDRPAPGRFPVRRTVFAVVALAVCAYIFLPYTVVTLTWAPQSGTHEVAFTAKSSYEKVDQEKREIPLRVITKDITQKTPITPTGTADIDAQKAYGTLTIYNTHSGEPQNLVATTRFETPEGIVFRLVRGVSVPGMRIEGDDVVPGTIEVSVVADQAGEEGNVAPTRWTIPGFKGSPDDKFENFYAESTVAMTGGSAGGTDVAVVTQDDIDRAAETSGRDRDAFVAQEIAALVRDTEIILPDALVTEVTREESIVAPGTATSTADFATTITLRAFVVRQTDIDHVVSGAIFGTEGDVRDYDPTVTYEDVRVATEDQKIFATASVTLGDSEDFDVDAFGAAIAGEPHTAITEIIKAQFQGVSHVSLSAYPSRPAVIGERISRFPWMTRISIVSDES